MPESNKQEITRATPEEEVDFRLHQPRERPVACKKCSKPTWNHDAICEGCEHDAV